MGGLMVNIVLGTPYLTIIQKMIERGYAASQTEVIRQALRAYQRQVDEEEVLLVRKGIKAAMADIHSGKTRLYTHAEMETRLNERRKDESNIQKRHEKTSN